MVHNTIKDTYIKNKQVRTLEWEGGGSATYLWPCQVVTLIYKTGITAEPTSGAASTGPAQVNVPVSADIRTDITAPGTCPQTNVSNLKMWTQTWEVQKLMTWRILGKHLCERHNRQEGVHRIYCSFQGVAGMRFQKMFWRHLLHNT